MDEQTKFREAYLAWDSARQEFQTVMRDILSGRDARPTDELMDMARELQRLFDAFMEAGEPFTRRGRAGVA